jgi:hypothetical protein
VIATVIVTPIMVVLVAVPDPRLISRDSCGEWRIAPY